MALEDISELDIKPGSERIGLSMSAIPEIDLEKCTGCGDCVEQCPDNAVSLVSGKGAIVQPQGCNYCTDCEAFCPSGAISCPFEIVLVKTETP